VITVASLSSRSRLLAVAAAAVVGLCWAAAAVAAGPLYARPLSARYATPLGKQSGNGTPICDFGDTQLVCYAPSHIEQAYNVPTGPNAPTGAGQTIVVIDAFGSPAIQGDLAFFDQHFGIPDGPFEIVCPQPAGCGTPPDPDTAAAWAVETSLDVEYAHAMAPGARIVLAIASSDEWSDLTATELAAIKKYPGAIVSESFGLSEPSPSDAEGIREIAGSFANHLLAWRLGTTIVAAAGDFGSTDGVVDANGNPVLTADYPSSDPLVTGVGGTMGLPYPAGLWKKGGYGNEQVWNESDLGLADGGGPSALFPLPSYQRSVANGSSRRMTPDIAFNAAIDGGVQVAVTLDGVLSRYVVGGNSAGAPQWAGIFALANELRGRQAKPGIGFANPLLYSIAQDRSRFRADFHDITVGDDILHDPLVDRSQWPTDGFKAAPGYDMTTGWGTPNVASLLPDLVAAGSDRGDQPDFRPIKGSTDSRRDQSGRPKAPKPHDGRHFPSIP
jgi:subtilase family serine protease